MAPTPMRSIWLKIAAEVDAVAAAELHLRAADRRAEDVHRRRGNRPRDLVDARAERFQDAQRRSWARLAAPIRRRARAASPTASSRIAAASLCACIDPARRRCCSQPRAGARSARRRRCRSCRRRRDRRASVLTASLLRSRASRRRPARRVRVVQLPDRAQRRGRRPRSRELDAAARGSASAAVPLASRCGVGQHGRTA